MADDKTDKTGTPEEPTPEEPTAEAPEEPTAEAPEEEPEAAGEPETEEAEEAETGEAEAAPKRRGSAETGARQQPAPQAPTNADGLVEVRARARFVRRAPRKARLVMDHIRGKSVGDARAILSHTPRAAAADVSKLLESAVANAENNFELDPDDLRIHRATVDEGPTIKRYRPRALGRATPIHKRTSHMTITLTTAGEADTRKAAS